jgi:hypothetical protein
MAAALDIPLATAKQMAFKRRGLLSMGPQEIRGKVALLAQVGGGGGRGPPCQSVCTAACSLLTQAPRIYLLLCPQPSCSLQNLVLYPSCPHGCSCYAKHRQPDPTHTRPPPLLPPAPSSPSPSDCGGAL